MSFRSLALWHTTLPNLNHPPLSYQVRPFSPFRATAVAAPDLLPSLPPLPTVDLLSFCLTPSCIMSTPHEPSLSHPPRTTSSHRPRTGVSRPETPASDRPDTSGSIISTLEPAPHTFRPDLEEFEEEEDDEDSDDSEADGVFAFSRPQTGQVPPLSANNNPFNIPFNTSPVLLPPSPSAESESPFTHRLPPSSSPNTAPHTDASPLSTGFDHRIPVNPIATPEPSLRYLPRSILQRSNTAVSRASKDSDEASPFDNDRHAVRMTSFAPLVTNRIHPDDSKVWFDDSREDLASDTVSYRGRSRGGTHMTSELGGPTTIPDGITTRGGGEQSQEDFEK
jgi:hypothetical protein